MRRAEWRRRADDPKTPLGWWWRGLVNLDWRWPVGSLAIVVCAWASTNGRPVIIDSLATGVFTGCLVVTRKRRDALAPLLPQPAPEGQFRASVEYRQKGLTTGRDEMALTVVDGWLHAEGVRSHFALRPEDVHRLKIDLMTQVDLDRKARFLLSDGSEIRLSRIDILAYVALNRWHAQDRGMIGEPTFPPARVHPQESARWKAWMCFGVGLIPLPRGVATLLHVWPESRLVVAAVMLIGCCVGYYATRKWSRLWDLDHTARRQEVLAGQAPPLQDSSESLTTKRSSP